MSEVASTYNISRILRPVDEHKYLYCLTNKRGVYSNMEIYKINVKVIKSD